MWFCGYSGDAIPRIDYTETEVATWNQVYNTVRGLMPKHFCQEYRKVFDLLEEENIFGPNHIPQLQDMSDFLNSESSVCSLTVNSPTLNYFAINISTPNYSATNIPTPNCSATIILGQQ